MNTRDEARERYYQDRAPVYDATSYRGNVEVDQGLDRETAELGKLLADLPPGQVLDVACGTGIWTSFLRGDVVAMDQSEEMLQIAATRVPAAKLVHGLFPPLPFADNSFDLLFTSNFYGLLRTGERALFLREAQRVAREMIIVDLRSDQDLPMEGMEAREIGNGSTYQIFRRRFTPESMRSELGGELFYEGRYFLAMRLTFTESVSAG